MAAILAELAYKVDSKDIDRAREKLKGLKDSSLGASGALSKLSFAAKGLGVLGFVVGVVTKLTSELAELGAKGIAAADKIAKTAKRIGLTAEEFQEYAYAARTAGLTTQEFADGFQRFVRRVGTLQATGKGQLAQPFKDLGIELKKTDGQIKTHTELFNEFANKIASTEGHTKKLNYAFAAFDVAGAKFVELVKDGADGMEKLRADARAAGIVISNDLAASAEEAANQMERMRSIQEALATKGQLALAPLTLKWEEMKISIYQAATELARFLGLLGEFEGKTKSELQSRMGEVEVDLVNAKLRAQSATGRNKAGANARVKELEAERARLKAELFRREQSNMSPISAPASDVAPPGGYVDPEKAAENDRRAAEEEKRIHKEKNDFLISLYDELAEHDRDMLTDQKDRINAQIDFEKHQFTRWYDEQLSMHEYTLEQKAKAEELYYAKMEQFEEKRQKQLEEANVFIQRTGDAFEDAFQRAIFEGGRFEDILVGILQQMAQAAFMQSTFGSLFNAAGSALGSWISGLFANGAAFQNGKVTAFANGGVVNQPTIFPMANGMGLMGEAGPEAVMPLRRGPGGRLGVEMYGGSSGGVNIGSINVTVQGGNTNEQTGEAVAQKIESMLRGLVNDELRNQMRPGNMFRPAAMSI